MKKITLATFVALVAGVLFVWGTGSASAQTVTSDPIQTTPGYPGCGGNSTVRDVTSDFTCGNQRTFHLGALTRTVIAISTFHADGTAQTTFTLTGGNAPTELKLRIVSHAGVSSSPGNEVDTATGVIPVGTKGPVTLSYLFDCGQVDIKAILTGNGESAGRISGPYVCKATVVTTTTTTVAPTTTVQGATTVPGQPTTTAAVKAAVVTAAPTQLPATGRNVSTPVAAAMMLTGAGAGLLFVTWYTRRRSSN